MIAYFQWLAQVSSISCVEKILRICFVKRDFSNWRQRYVF